MPNLSAKQGSKGTRSKKPVAKKPSLNSRLKFGKGKKSTVDDIVNSEPDDVVMPGSDIEESVEEETKKKVESEFVDVLPFTDGIVASQLRHLVAPPSSSNAETEFLKELLSEVAIDEPMFGMLASQLSFMKNNGGLLM